MCPSHPLPSPGEFGRTYRIRSSTLMLSPSTRRISQHPGQFSTSLHNDSKQSNTPPPTNFPWDEKMPPSLVITSSIDMTCMVWNIGHIDGGDAPSRARALRRGWARKVLCARSTFGTSNTFSEHHPLRDAISKEPRDGAARPLASTSTAGWSSIGGGMVATANG